MLNRNGTRLNIFENFRIHRKISREAIKNALLQINEGESSPNVFISSRGMSLNDFVSDNEIQTNKNSIISYIRRFFIWLRVLAPAPIGLSVKQFFDSVKKSTESLVCIPEVAEGYEKALKHAEAFGQTARAEMMKKNIAIFRSHLQLLDLGLDKVIKEQSIISFYKKSDRALKLTWIENYNLHIPAEVLEKCSEANNRLIFDNYVILHYDPNGKSYKETQAQIDKRRDPILFGVIEGSDLLYYIGDWVDEYCDLTLEKFAELAGKDEIKHLSLVDNSEINVT
jgi:hypothetical protein